MPDVVSLDKKMESLWNKINEKIKDAGLEKALDGIDNEDLRSSIIKIAGDFLARIDAKYKKKVYLPISMLFQWKNFF